MTEELRDVVDVMALTPTQEGMLYHSLAEPDTDVFHSQVTATLPADLDVDGFRRAWSGLVERHETLRTAFFWDGLDQPLAVVRPEGQLEWEIEDWTGLGPNEFEDRLSRLLERDGFTPFALDEAPLMRMRLIRRFDGEWTWLWTFHHAILDGWSVRILMRELADLYGGSGSSLTDPVSPREYLDWLSNQDIGKSRSYWTQQLAHVKGSQTLEAPGLPPSGRGHDRLDVALSTDLVGRLQKTAVERRTTLSTLVTAAWSLVLSSVTSSEDVVVGVTTSGRPPRLEGVENLVGLFLNTLPLLSTVRPETTLDEYLKQIQESQLALVEHQDIGLAELHRLAGIRGSESLFESIVVFENLPPESGSEVEVSFENLDFRERSNFPLALLATPGEEFTLRLVFDRERFAPTAADRLLEATVAALEQMTTPGLRLSDMRLTTMSESELVGPEMRPPSTTVVDDIAELAHTRSEDIALATMDETVSYGEMWTRVNRLANEFAADGLGRGDRIGVMMPRSIDMIVTILAALRVGAAYVPLDPTYPRSHIEVIIQNSGLSTIVVDDSVTDPPEISRHVGSETGTVASSALQPHFPALGDIAYVIHTSGTTGRPKGIPITHDNLASSTAARRTYYESAVGAFLLLSSTSFDSSVAGIFWTLTTGGCLVLPDELGESDPIHLNQLMKKRSVTHLLALPSLHAVLAEEIGRLPETLGCAIVAGEAVDSRVVEAHFGASQARLFNEYGPTEATVWATVGELQPGHVTASIGKPIAGTSVQIANHLGGPVPRGFAGELIIRGRGVAGGYLDDPDATKETFDSRAGERSYRTGDRCAIGVDGDVHFLGRMDSQLKIRGHRIEPSGVAATLRSRPGVSDAAVAAKTVRGVTALVGYIEGDAEVEVVERDLARRLPRHLVPDHIEVLDHLPRLPNGKIDTNSLPNVSMPSAETGAPPTTPTESALAEIWADLLELSEVGVDLDFFDLGGDSIMAIKMVSQARRGGLEISPADAVANPTIRGLARVADGTEDQVASPVRCLVPIRSEGSRTPVVCVHAVNGRILPFRNLANHLERDQPVYAFTPLGLKADETPLESIPDMARLYVDELKSFQPDGPYRLLGECFGASVCLEMARLLEDQGDLVSQVVVIDGALPWESARAVSLTAKARRAVREGGIREVARGMLRRVTRRVRQARDVRYGDTDARFEVYRQRVFEASIAAFGRFTPSRVKAPILLIKATEENRPTGEAYRQPEWAEYTTDLIEAYVDTDHLSILREPGVGEVARIVTAHG